MFLFHFDTNYTFARRLKFKSNLKLNLSLTKTILVLVSQNYQPKFWILENEVSELTKVTFEQVSVKVQLAPPGMHRRNMVDWATGMLYADH